MPIDKSFIINSVLSPALMADALEITVSSSSKKNTFLLLSSSDTYLVFVAEASK